MAEQSSFLLNPTAGETDADRAQRAAADKAATERVSKVLESRHEDHGPRRALRRFGCNLVVALYYHCKGKVRRVESVMSDHITWGTTFQKWVVTQIGLKEGAAHDMTFQYFNRTGHSVRVNKHSALVAWLDESWARHTPQLHCYDTNSMLEEAEDKAFRVAELFDEYTSPGSDSITFESMREMLLRLDLVGERAGGARRISSEVDRHDVIAFINAEVDRADADNDGLVTRQEFDSYYNSLQDHLKDSISDENRYEFTLAKYIAASVQARSFRRSLTEWVRGFDGKVLLDSQGHQYHVEVTLPPACLEGADGAKWVSAQSVIEHSIDHVGDATGRMGEICSTIVEVVFEDGLKLGASYQVTFPHCFDMEQGLSKEDVLVVFATRKGSLWHEVNPDHWDFVEADSACTYPRLRVTLPMPGIVCLCARNNVKAKLRTQVLAYMPAMVIPLESEEIHIYVTDCLPDKAEEILQHEMQIRGAVSLIGSSKSMPMRPNSQVELSIKTDDVERHSLCWRGETQSVTFDVDPRFLMQREMGATMKMGAGGVDHDAETEVRVQLQLSVSITDLGARNLAVCSSGGGARSRNRDKITNQVALNMSIHIFASPSAPRELKVQCRTQHMIELMWKPPTSWGGCALHSYEVQIREINHKGEAHEWDDAFHVEGHTLSGKLDRNVYKCDFRIRAYNIASAIPSDWMQLSLGTVKDEEAALAIQKTQRGKVCRSNEPQDRYAQHGSQKKITTSESDLHTRSGRIGVKAEGGVAAVVQEELCVNKPVEKKVKPRKAESVMKGWSPFCRTLGEFYLEMGVRGGVEGHMFELTPHNCEELVIASHEFKTHMDIGLSTERPLMSLAKIATWILQTLAHYAEDSESWIDEIHAMSGLVNLASKVDVALASKLAKTGAILPGDRRLPYLTGTLKCLLDTYETLRQCEPHTGFITCQLNNRYDKSLKRAMEEEWQLELLRLRHSVAHHVMNLMLITREMVSHQQQHPKAQGALLHIVNFSVANVLPHERAFTGAGLCLAFTLEGGITPTQRSLTVPCSTQPVWEDGAITLSYEGAPPPLKVRVELVVLPLPSYVLGQGEEPIKESVLGSATIDLTEDASNTSEEGMVGLARVMLEGPGVNGKSSLARFLYRDAVASKPMLSPRPVKT